MRRSQSRQSRRIPPSRPCCLSLSLSLSRPIDRTRQSHRRSRHRGRYSSRCSRPRTRRTPCRRRPDRPRQIHPGNRARPARRPSRGRRRSPPSRRLSGCCRGQRRGRRNQCGRIRGCAAPGRGPSGRRAHHRVPASRRPNGYRPRTPDDPRTGRRRSNHRAHPGRAPTDRLAYPGSPGRDRLDRRPSGDRRSEPTFRTTSASDRCRGELRRSHRGDDPLSRRSAGPASRGRHPPGPRRCRATPRTRRRAP
jgi:hypothetical protein